MKIPSANTMVSTMTPMIRSPNRSSRRETSAEPMPQGNISRATAGNARMEINASLTGRITNHPPAMCDCSVPVLIRCQDSSARRSQLSHFGHWDAAIAHLLPGKLHPAADGTTIDAGNGSRWRWDPLEREGNRTKNRRHRIRGLPPYGTPFDAAIGRDRRDCPHRQVADQSRQKSLNRAGLSCV
jgi:hypothetical protein